MTRGLMVGLACFFLVGTATLPAEVISPAPMLGPSATTQQTAPVSGFASVATTATALVAIVGIGLYFLKNGRLPFRTQSGTERKLHVRETRMLGSRQFLVVVEYEDSKLLLGVTPGKIDYLCALENRTSASEPFSAVLEGKDSQAKPGEME